MSYFGRPPSPHPFLERDVAMLGDNTAWCCRLAASLRLPSGLPVVVRRGFDNGDDKCEVMFRINTRLFPEDLRDKWDITMEFFELRVTNIDKLRFRAINGNRKDNPVIRARSPNGVKHVAIRQIVRFFRHEFNLVYALGVGNEALMEPDEHGSVFFHLLRQVANRMRGATEHFLLFNDNLVNAYPRMSPSVVELLLVLLSRANEAPLQSSERKLAMGPDPLPEYAEATDSIIADLKPIRFRRYGSVEDEELIRGASSPTWNHQYAISAYIAAIPCTRKIFATSVDYKKFKRNRPQAAKLLEWLLVSVSARIVEVPISSISVINADFMFVVRDISSRQKIFERFKKECGKTRLLFHGSSIRNWHSIIRTGLRVYSHTEFQQTGAVHGAGIYFTNDFNSSFVYARRGFPTMAGPCAGDCCEDEDPLPSEAAYIIAICEVIDNGQLKQYKEVIFTADHTDMVSIRILLVYNRPPISSADVMLDEKMTEEIRSLLEIHAD